MLARLVMLERKVLVYSVAEGESEAIKEVLEDVRHSRPAVGRDTLPVMQSNGDAEAACAVLREVAQPAELEAVAAKIAGKRPALAELLRRAALDDQA